MRLSIMDRANFKKWCKQVKKWPAYFFTVRTVTLKKNAMLKTKRGLTTKEAKKKRQEEK